MRREQRQALVFRRKEGFLLFSKTFLRIFCKNCCAVQTIVTPRIRRQRWGILCVLYWMYFLSLGTYFTRISESIWIYHSNIRALRKITRQAMFLLSLLWFFFLCVCFVVFICFQNENYDKKTSSKDMSRKGKKPGDLYKVLLITEQINQVWSIIPHSKSRQT